MTATQSAVLRQITANGLLRILSGRKIVLSEMKNFVILSRPCGASKTWGDTATDTIRQ